MKKFIVNYHAPVDVSKQIQSLSTKEREAGREEWSKWAKRIGNKLVDMGTPLTNGLEIDPTGKIVNTRTDVVGYSILQAESLDEAKSLVKNHPHLESNPKCTIELLEEIEM